ncbi:hypothetical protein [Pseudomonas sp. Irchel s3f19]|uniref:hypothetical protein n=1 Tax=Pseudomonas sp. Irchel s3f19 TaxID=2009146 RepID=UPI000BA4B186|nr:hypothetical protein [Pseudomonas sp. Irchel s3f19]
MNADIRNSQMQYAQTQQLAEAAAAQFRSNSRFFVQQGENNSWAIVGSNDNRLYGQRREYPDAVSYAKSLERVIDSKSAPTLTVAPPDDIRTRWLALWALALIVVAGAFAS